MTRFPQFKYRIGHIENDVNWILITDPNDTDWGNSLFDSWADDEEQCMGPVEFLLRIQEKTHWTIKKAGLLQYKFEEDPLQMIFQMDDLFGFAVLTDKENLDQAISFLQEYME